MIRPLHANKGKFNNDAYQSVDTVFCLTQCIAEQNNVLDTVICWTHCILDICLVFLFQMLNMLPNVKTFRIWASFRPLLEIE